MKTLYLMRHGETLFNKRGLMQGACDSPLTVDGIKQAKVAKAYFEENNITFDHAYSSTSERASDTLELITDMNYQRIKSLKEYSFGMYEAASEDLTPKWPWGDTFLDYGGESDTQFYQRINETLLAIMNQEDHENVLVVAHGCVLIDFFKLWKEHSDYQGVEHINNCKILKYEFKDNIFNCVEEIEHDFSDLDNYEL